VPATFRQAQHPLALREREPLADRIGRTELHRFLLLCRFISWNWWSGEIGATKKIEKLVQGFLRYIRSTTTHATGNGAVELVSREIVEFS